MKILNVLKARVLDDVLFVMRWRAYITASALLLSSVIFVGSDVGAWSSTGLFASLPRLLLIIVVVIDDALILYYVVRIILVLVKKRDLSERTEVSSAQLSFYRWASFCCFALVLMCCNIMYQKGVGDINPDLYPFAACFYGTVILLAAGECLFRIIGLKIIKNPENDPLKTDDGQGIARKNEKTP